MYEVSIETKAHFQSYFDFPLHVSLVEKIQVAIFHKLDILLGYNYVRPTLRIFRLIMGNFLGLRKSLKDLHLKQEH